LATSGVEAGGSASANHRIAFKFAFIHFEAKVDQLSKMPLAPLIFQWHPQTPLLPISTPKSKTPIESKQVKELRVKGDKAQVGRMM
jgi:hypothetical protein